MHNIETPAEYIDLLKKETNKNIAPSFLYCLLANAISGAKLVKMFEEAKFRCVKVQFSGV